MTEELYQVSHHETRLWGSLWCGPDVLPHGEPVRIAQITHPSKDGQAVEVFCTAMPARFYHIICADGTRIDTGSGMGELAHTLALEIAAGGLIIGEAD